MFSYYAAGETEQAGAAFLEAREILNTRLVPALTGLEAVKVEVPVKYIGFDIPNEFVIGYGLDYAERYRDLPYIATLKPEVYA